MAVVLSSKPGGSGGGGAPSGPAGGDLAGTYPNPTIDAQSSADGLVLTSDGANGTAFERPPGFQLAYVEFTANVTITSTTEATPNDVVTAGAIVFDGATRVCIEFFSPWLATNAGIAVISLWDDSTNLGLWGEGGHATSTADNAPCLIRRYLTPSAASHTYRARAFKTAGTCTVAAGLGGGAGVVVPGYIRIAVA